MKDISVLIVARPGDEHGDAVEQALRSREVSVARLSFNTLRAVSIDWQPDRELRIESAEGAFALGAESTIWWRRPGWPETHDLEPKEAEFVDSEIRVMLVGMLLASQARWVDHPMVVEQGENKLFQLAVASRCGCSVPASNVTNSLSTARRFATTRPVVAKSVSVGEGIAPFADEVPQALLEKVKAAPVLLQERVDAVGDLRIVTVGNRAFTWRRERLPKEPLDWRRSDPAGEGFEFRLEHAAEGQALAVADALGLSHSAQDWLETRRQPVFLEANPGGQWLFLSQASRIVTPVLIEHLFGRGDL